MGTGSPSNPDVGQLLHRMRSTLARLKGEVELAELDGHPFAGAVAETIEDALRLVNALQDAHLGDRAPGNASALVCVIDDDHRLAAVTVRQLIRAGWAAISEDALPAMSDPRTIFIVDYGVLIGLNEAQLAALRGTRFIVVSGTVDPDAAIRAGRLGASAFLTKPVEIGRLSGAVDAVARQDHDESGTSI